MATAITKKPTLAVTNLTAPTRSGSTMTTKWSAPKDLVNVNKNNRAEGYGIFWYLGKSSGELRWWFTSTNLSSTTHSVNLNSWRIGSTTFTRNSFYPRTNVRLNYVGIKILPKNRKGWGPVAHQVRRFYPPRAPQVSAPSFNNENGIVSATITTDAGADYQERYDTRYTVTVMNPFLNGGRAKNTSDSSSTSTSFNLTYDASQYMNLSYSQYIQVTFKAWARGYAGDSGTSSRTMYVSYPAQATIQGVDVSSRDSSGKCTVRVKTNSSTTHPVDKIKLQYAADVEYDNANDIPGSVWQDTDIQDNANCTALAIAVSELIPTRGNHTWVRVVTYHLNENVLFRYSEPMMVSQLETPATPTAQINIRILSAHAGEDGKSAVVQLGWNEDGSDDFTGTEISWSDTENTWKSTEEPSHHEFTWSDGEVTHEGTTYRDSATITIKGLNEGKHYYIKARRYLDETGEFSNYSDTATVLTSEKPEAIVASAARYISDGEPLSVYWTFAGNGIQTEWQIVDSNGTVIAEGKGSAGATQISAERLKELAVDNSISYTVQASTGSGFVSSEEHTVTIIEMPTLSVVAPTSMTAQPYSFTATANGLCDLIVIVTSQGVSGQSPQGIVVQPAGDTIHSDVYVPIWEQENDEYTATVTLPEGLDFKDLGNYTLSVIAVDRTTGLRSAEQIKEFAVNWARKAPDPTNAVTLTVIDEIDEDGDHRQAVQIELTPPTGSTDTDVYDIYRMDIEKPSLIGQDFPLTHTTVDEYAPFGSDVTLKYRIAVRTIDGDVAFADIDYLAECNNIRFDWATGSLELPYGLSIGDSFTKDVKIRQHLNGGVDGYWNPNIERKSSLNSCIVKILQPQDIERARLLARYAGAVFVRLPNGSAFEADVQITDLSVKNKAVMDIAIDATEIGLTQDFILPSPFVAEEE